MANILFTNGYGTYLSYLINGGSPNMYFALGSGESSWDYDGLPTPTTNTTSLVNEVLRQPVVMADCKYVDPTNYDTISDTPTNVLRLDIVVDSSLYYGVSREYGLFAIDATSASGSGTMILYCNHEVVSISDEITYHKYIYLSN